MNELDVIYRVLKIINGDEKLVQSPIPIFSFEGLPGAGKTTQIKLVSDVLTKKYGKSYYIDLPTKSSIGKILKSLYSNEKQWNELRSLNPWFNPIMISTDLWLAVERAVAEGAKYVFMSRGILSTYYYNLDAYGKDENYTWIQMQEHMKAFYMPSVIIFMDIPEEIAFERVIKRNRGVLRKMDKIEQMKKDKVILQNYLKKIHNTPVHYIDALGTKGEVTTKIIEKVEGYLNVY